VEASFGKIFTVRVLHRYRIKRDFLRGQGAWISFAKLGLGLETIDWQVFEKEGFFSNFYNSISAV